VDKRLKEILVMQTLRLGSTGDDVKDWQYFLRGLEKYLGEVDGKFGPRTLAATQEFQRGHALIADGIVGNRTFGRAMLLGFHTVPDDPALPDTLDWPSKPQFGPLDQAARAKLFGQYDFVADPVPENPEQIRILGGWEGANIQLFTIPQLAGKRGANLKGRAQFHKLVGPRVIELFARWEAEGLLGHVLTYAGSFAPRFVRGTRDRLSPHAFGSAFDINARWNGFGAVPAQRGADGSLRELVPIANELGFYWGGHFGRRDGMHFELAVL
jgi:peptidoglycan hydrolase-like protein with peptidoglycan-binding domain